MSAAIQHNPVSTLSLMSRLNPQPAPERDILWTAVLERNAGFDGIVFYGVRTTGIYCRPTCPSRRPRREVVDFFSTPESAEDAGLRPCKRCRPRLAKNQSPQAELVRGVCDYIEQNLEGTLTLRTIAAEVGGSPFHIQRTFREALGITPFEYAEARRMAYFRQTLKVGQSVADATYDAGFSSSSRIYERAQAHLGMTPAVYKKGAPEQKIAYSITESPMGRLLVAKTDKGLCKVAMGSDDRAMKEELVGEFPRAEVRADNSGLGRAVQQIVAFLKGKRRELDLPTDLRATAFQIRVWKELQKIPFGETRSYAEVARRIGRPRAVRAVARACATNPVALVVPCHRVVRKGGGLGGYRWGVERKRTILAREKATADRRG